MVRYIGADKSNTANSTFRAPDTNPQALTQSNQSFQFAAQQYQNVGDQLKGSLQFQAQTAAQMSKDFMQTNESAKQTQLQTLQAKGNSDTGFKQALGNLANVGQMIVQTLDNKSKQQQAQTKAVRDQNASVMWERMSQWEAEAPSVARLDPAGTVKLRSQVDDMFKTTEGADISGEDREKLMKHAYGTVIAGLSSKNVEDLVTQQKKLQEINQANRVQKSIFEASSLLSSLGAASTVEEQDVSVAKLSEYLGAIATSDQLDPMNKAEIQLGLSTMMVKNMFTSEDNRQKAQGLLTRFNQFQGDVLEARKLYPDSIDKQQQAIAYSAMANDIPNSVVEGYDPDTVQKKVLSRAKVADEFRVLRDEETARTLGSKVTDEEAGYYAQIFKSDSELEAFAADIAGGNAKLGKGTTLYNQVVAANKALKDFKELQSSVRVKSGQLQQAKARVAQGDASKNLEYLRTLKPTPQTNELISRLRISTGNNEALGALLPLIGQYEQMDKQAQAQFDQKYSEAVAQGFNASAELSRAYDLEYEALNSNLYAKRRELMRYGFKEDGTYDPYKAKVIEQRKADLEVKRQQEYQRKQDGLGVSNTGAPFNSAKSSGFNGLEVFVTSNSPTGELILPLAKTTMAKQAKPNINEGVGWREWAGRQHNGQDVGVDSKTPIVAQMDGKVTEVNYQAQGGGHYVRIEYPDGTEHTFMHLYHRPNLAQGQIVKAGQVVGLAGNTGLAGGNSNVGNTHLHWEVRKRGTLITPQQWSKEYKTSQLTARSQPRSKGPGSSVTAPIKGSVGIPIKGGLLVPNGKGGATPVAYNSSLPPSSIFYGLKDMGQQKTSTAKPKSKVAVVTNADSKIFYGPGGSMFVRDSSGKLRALPQSKDKTYTNTNPLRNLTNSNRASDYNLNDVDNNHGFLPLKKRPQAARAINEIAKGFGVPGEWLAEVISVETNNTFDPAIKEFGGSGATGLIQFYPDREGGSTKTINGRVYQLSDIGRMSLEQQLRGPVRDYIKEAMSANGMKKIPTIQDLYGLVYAYGNADKARRMGDAHGNSGQNILDRLGKFSGRNYNNSRRAKLTARIDTKPSASCTTCQQMTNLSAFVPHERQSLNTGTQLFNYA